MSTLNTGGHETAFDSQSATKLVLVRKLAASIVREYGVADTADKAAIDAIVGEITVILALIP